MTHIAWRSPHEFATSGENTCLLWALPVAGGLGGAGPSGNPPLLRAASSRRVVETSVDGQQVLTSLLHLRLWSARGALRQARVTPRAAVNNCMSARLG